MKIFSFKYWAVAFLLLCFNNTINAQAGLCPSNLDFESGDFTGWQCQAGIVDAAGNLVLSPTAPIPGRHTIITAGGFPDPFGGFPQLCPNGSGYSVKLGNSGGNHQAESVSYIYTIPNTLTVFSMLFHYAVVLQDPAPPHLPNEQPRFRARIVDMSNNAPIPCVNFDFIASGSLPGFQLSPSGVGVWYKDWTPISIDLSSFIGRTIKLEFITNDCVFTQHFGYAYLDINTNCNGVISGNFICPGDTELTLTAPYGFQSYQWFSDPSMTTVISTNQTLVLNPLPAVGSVFPVVVTPYTGFGCTSTLFATIDVGTAPNANAGLDQLVCNNSTVQIGSPNNVSYDYEWRPAAQVSGTTISNPMAWIVTGTGPDTIIVKTTDILTGCVAEDSVILNARTIDTALALTGKITYCTGDAAAGSLSVSNVLAAVQWYEGNTPIPGATGYTYLPTASGNYWAQVQQNGCTDSTRITAFTINQTPVSIAGGDANICVNQTIQLGTASNPAYSYAWTPSAQVSNPAIGDPVAWVNPDGATIEFTVTTTDIASGCFSTDNVFISGRTVDTALSISGKMEYCKGDLLAGTLSVSNSLAAIQWFDGATPVPGANSPVFLPIVSGDYWAQVQQNGCTDSTLTRRFDIHAVPVVGFTASSDTGCITKHSFLFTNNSNPPDGANLNYTWRFSDGTTQTVTDAIKTFLVTGDYTIKLVTTSEFGCADSTGFYAVHVLPNGEANFRYDSICINRASLFYNTSSEKNSPQVNYSWNFNNNGPLVTVKNPAAVIYAMPGKVDVTLILTALGCENDPDSVVRKVQVNISKPGTRYTSITVPEGATQFIHARDSVGTYFQWSPQVQLNNYHARYTQFTATDDVMYQIRISDIHTCVTLDTLQMLVLKKPGYYLPTAFTPNGDGLNDVAIPYLVKMKSLVNFSIFNRWGNRVFYSQQEGKGWNGRMMNNGEALPNGVYVWILEFIDPANKKVTEKGMITLIR